MARHERSTLLPGWLPAGMLLALAVTCVCAQPKGLLLDAPFDTSLDGASARGDGTAQALNTFTRSVSVRTEGKAVQVRPGGHLSYAAQGNLGAKQGAIELGAQPLARFRMGRNRRLICIGKPEQPGSIHVWKTALHNDLRFRIVAADGKWVEAVYEAMAGWEPGQWHHILCSWDLGKGYVQLWVDGRQGQSWRGQAPDIPGPPNRIFVGSAPDGSDAALCAIDNLRIHATAIPGARVQRLYEQFLAEERISSTGQWEGGADAVSDALLPEPEFTFVVITDVHASEPGALGRYKHNHRLARLVEQINLISPEFVLNLGDTITTFPGHDEYDACAQMGIDMLGKLRMPMHHVPGNHDVGNKLQLTYHGPPGTAFEKGWFISPENIALYQKWFGPDYYSFDHKGCHFIVLNNQLFNSGLAQESKQWQWLEKDLAASRDAKMTFMAMHNPLLWIDPEEPGTGNYENVNQPARGRLMALADQYGVRIVFTGHTHHRISNFIDGTQYLTLPSTGFARNFGPNYGIPNLATVWDPERVGYYVCRVYPDAVRCNLVRTYDPLPPTGSLQKGNEAGVARMLGLKAAEVDEGAFAVSVASPPMMSRGIWSAAHVIDGVHAGNLGTRNIEAHAWTSDRQGGLPAGRAARADCAGPHRAAPPPRALRLSQPV